MNGSLLLDVCNITVRFEGLMALDDVSLTVTEGEIVGLIGPNGAGKTTLFNVICGLLPPTEGRLFFAGAEMSDLLPHERARLGIARSFQNLGLMMSESVETNVLAGQDLNAGYGVPDPILRPRRWLAHERRLLRTVDAALEPFGLREHRHTVVSDLSFAAARSVELATALIRRPRMLLLDEPTTGLDPAEVGALAEALTRVREQGATILVIAHDVGFVMDVCDRVYVLAGGRELAAGPPEVVQHDPNVIEAYLGSVRA